MSWLVALLGAAGALLVFDGLSAPPRDRRVPPAMAERLAAAGWSMRPATFACIAVGSAVAVALLAVAILPSPAIGVAGAVAGGAGPFAVAARAARRRRRSVQEAWPDALAHLVSAVRSGAGVGEACAALSSRGPAALRPAFTAFTVTYRTTGSLREGLRRLREEAADPVGDRVCIALEVAHDVGGTSLVKVLRTLSDQVRDDLRTRREVEARWAWTVAAARLAAASPWVVLLLMSARPEAARAYASPSGTAVIVAGVVATALGYLLMLRAARLPEFGRLGS